MKTSSLQSKCCDSPPKWPRRETNSTSLLSLYHNVQQQSFSWHKSNACWSDCLFANLTFKIVTNVSIKYSRNFQLKFKLINHSPNSLWFTCFSHILLTLLCPWTHRSNILWSLYIAWYEFEHVRFLEDVNLFLVHCWVIWAKMYIIVILSNRPLLIY